MIPLNLDMAVLYGSSGAATRLELLSECLKRRFLQGDAGDHRHALAVSTFGLPPNTDNAVPLRTLGGLLSTDTALKGFSARRTHSSNASGIDHPGLILFGHEQLMVREIAALEFYRE
ncbi:MAG: hypothetical protein RLZZ627_1184 [Pseudomonadota bacterium]